MAMEIQMKSKNRALNYPAARASDHADVYFGTTVADPYRWMEDLDSDEVEAWVNAENALTRDYLSDVPERNRIHARMLQLVDYERFSAPEREGGRYFYQRNSGLQNQAVLFWQQGESGEPVVLLDPNQLSADGTVALQGTAVSSDGKLMAYALAEAGSDLQTIRVRVVDTGEDLADVIEWVKFSGISWKKDGIGFFYSSFGIPGSEAEKAEALKQAAFFHKLYFHRLGTRQSDDAIVFERADDKEMTISGWATDDGRWLGIWQGKIGTNALALKDLTQPGWDAVDAPVVWIAPTNDASYGWIRCMGDEVWITTNKDASNSKVMKVSLKRPEPEYWVTVVPETANSLEDATMLRGTLILTYLVDAKSEVELRTSEGALLEKLQLPGIGTIGMGSGKQEDTETFYTFTNYTTPATLYKLDVPSRKSSVWKQPRLTFDPSQYETSQIFATSKDGTRVPLFVTHKRNIALDGRAPVLMHGYGGFSVSLGPAYSSSRLAWLELGGIYAEAILRGGGEYGEAWHLAGTGVRKQNTFDDFIACAETLIDRKYTSAERLAINGGSNGGLLVAVAALQRPELFGAVVAQVGVMDMLRFDQFTIGYAWKPDYGSPSDVEEQFRANLKFSPVHNVTKDTAYPPMLITTADHDDRVFPAHSFKFAAAMQAAAAATPGSAPALIRIEKRAGHGAGMPLSKQVDVTADMYAFLVKELGM